MWYVVQVRVGTEHAICTQCENRISGTILERCFVPQYEEKRHVRGKWQVLRKNLFPGYVFMVTDEPEELYKGLKLVDGLTKIIGTGDEIVPLTDEEVELLQKLGGEEQVVEMSEGIIENSVVKIQSGPLQGMEALICKIDRHKRKAYLEVEMFGRVQRVEAGLEIFSKS